MGLNLEQVLLLNLQNMLKVGLSPSKKFVLFFLYESPLKMMKNVFYFILKALFVLKIFTFFVLILVMWKKRFDLKDKVNFKIYDVTTWFTNNYNKHIAQYHTK